MSPRIGVILLCRHSSRRFSGKILREIDGQPILSIILQRIEKSYRRCDVVVCTSNEASDDPISDYCELNFIKCYRGPLNNVAKRFLDCMSFYNFEYGIRINGDNVFVDFDLLGEVIQLCSTNQYEFITNLPERTYPFGMSIEAVKYDFYEKAYSHFSNDKEYLEHVTSWVYDNYPAKHFGIKNHDYPNLQGLDLAIDYPDDLIKIESLVKNINKGISEITLRDLSVYFERMDEKCPWKGSSGPLLITEIGGNHEGNFEYAKKLTKLAIECGSDCIKFQLYQGDTLVNSVKSESRNKHFKKFELSKEQHIELARICHEAGIIYMASVWDIDMLDWVDEFMPIYKVGSGDLTAWPLLEELAKRGKPIILSTGLATLEDVIQTVRFIQRTNPIYFSKNYLAVLQCTSMYPIEESDANLSVMHSIKEATGLTVGYSDHTTGSDALCVAAAMGAELLEFHFTDNRENKDFRDHLVSLTPPEVEKLKKNIKLIKKLQGAKVKIPQKIEVDNGHTSSFRRSIYLKRDINPGEIVNREDLIYLRPLSGLDARYSHKIIGRTAKKKINAFSSIDLENMFI